MNNDAAEERKGKTNSITGLPDMRESTKDKLGARFFWYRLIVPVIAFLMAMGLGFGVHKWGET